MCFDVEKCLASRQGLLLVRLLQVFWKYKPELPLVKDLDRMMVKSLKGFYAVLHK